MKVLSLKVKEDILMQTDQMVKDIHISRNAYINKALELYNQLNRRRILKKKLAIESKAVSISSLDILAEMEKLDDGDVNEN
jgi:hypothetical protein